MTDVILILLLGVGLSAALAWLARALRDLRTDWSSQLSERNAEVDRRLVGVTETMDRRLGELDTKVDRRLESASQTTNGSSCRIAAAINVGTSGAQFNCRLDQEKLAAGLSEIVRDQDDSLIS